MPRSIVDVNAIHGRHGFDPNQPRVPAGHSDGGQWTTAGAHGPASGRREVELEDSGEEAWEPVSSTYRRDGTLAEQEVVNRDGSEKDLHSEVSYLKTLAETGEKPVNYGTKGSIRVDVLENTNTGAVCVYDIKTGLSGLYPGRSLEIARAVYKYHPNAQSIIVIEMRPSRRR